MQGDINSDSLQIGMINSVYYQTHATAPMMSLITCVGEIWANGTAPRIETSVRIKVVGMCGISDVIRRLCTFFPVHI